MEYPNRETIDDVSRKAKGKVSDVSNKARAKTDEAEARLTSTISSLSESLTDRAQKLADQFQDISQQLRVRAGEAKDKTSETVGKHPFYAIGVAAVVGATVGLLFSRRK